MTENITKEFITSHTLMECLKEFTGAPNDPDTLKKYIEDHSLKGFREELLKQFETDKQLYKKKEVFLSSVFHLLAAKMIYGGHFEVMSGGEIIRRIYIHTVEFYYHEESDDDNAVHDYIVYHRNARKSKLNPNPSDNPLPPFPTGSLHTHISGIDSTFEDNKSYNQKTKKYYPKYRASALIRSFMVVDLSKMKDEVTTKETEEADNRSTHLYNALFMDFLVKDHLYFGIEWIDYKKWKFYEPYHNWRLRVSKYKDEELDDRDKNGYRLYKKTKKFEQDMREWAFSKDSFKE